MLDDLQNAAANALPPPREDEPPALRQEILDELADHFACAYRRELLRTRGDAELSKRNVLKRFGNPAHIARKLWFDAMKGKLMAQKFMVFATCLSVVLMAVIAFMGWRLVEASQQATSALIARSQETSAALLAQSRETQAAILARLEAQGEDSGAEWGDSLEWSEFELKFVEEGTGEPARDLTVNVTGPVGVGGSSEYVQEYVGQRPDANGIFRISPAHVGKYSVIIHTATGATLNEVVPVRPGHDVQKTYVVPKKPERGTVDLKIQWPKRLRGRDIWAIVGALQDSTRMVDGHQWMANVPRFFAIHPGGRVVDLAKVYPSYDQSSYVGGVSEMSLLRDAVNATHGLISSGLENVQAGRLAPFLLGIYPRSTFPEDPKKLFAELVAIGFHAPEGNEDIPWTSFTFPRIGAGLFNTEFQSMLSIKSLSGN